MAISLGILTQHFQTNPDGNLKAVVAVPRHGDLGKFEDFGHDLGKFETL